MMYFTVVTWLGTALQVVFLTVGLAAALYYVAELVEEYTSVAAKVLNGLILCVMGVHVGFLMFEDVPAFLSAIGIASQITHVALMNTFPCFRPASPSFIAGVGLLVGQHYLAFQHFGEVYHEFSEVLAYFTICLWLVPFGFFVSLSANDQVLPTMSPNLIGGSEDVVSSYMSRTAKKGPGLLAAFNYAKDRLLPARQKRFS